MLYDWMRRLVVYLVLSGIIVNLTPSGNYKRYVNFFTGLVVIIIMAKPPTHIINIGAVDIDKIVNDMEYGMNNNQYINRETDACNYFEMGMSGEIEKTLVNDGFETEGVDVITNKEGEIYRCYIFFNNKLDDETVNVIKNKVNDVYNVDYNNIYIVSR